MCRRILGDTAEADDIEQEASLQAYLGLGRLADASNFGPWFHAIGANLARKAIRKRRPTPIGDLREHQHVLWLAPDPGPEDAVGAHEVHDLILACLRAFLLGQGGAVLASHGPGDPGIAARYAAARALGDTDLVELSMLDLFPEEEVDCVLHATPDDGQLRLEAALPIGFGEQRPNRPAPGVSV